MDFVYSCHFRCLQTSDAVMILYDISTYDSLKRAREWHERLEGLTAKGYPEFTYMLMGAKCDLEDKRTVPQAEAMEYASEIMECTVVYISV